MSNIQFNEEELRPLIKNLFEEEPVWKGYVKYLYFSLCCFLCILPLIFIPAFFTMFYGFIVIFAATPTDCKYYNPSNFSIMSPCLEKPLDLTPYYIPKESWEEVSFSSRDDFWKTKGGGIISAYYLKKDPNRATIIQVHGYRGCKQNGIDLLASAILWKAGYNVLAIDLRNHGKSDRYNFQIPVVTFGSEEHKDILGAFDWLQNKTSKPIGLMGISMGGASSLIAAWKEPRIKAVFGDGAVCMIRETISKIAYDASGGLTISESFLFNTVCPGSFKSVYGCPKFENDPREAIKHLQQPVHLDHHEDDKIVFKFNTDVCGKELKDRLGDKVSIFMENKKSNNPKCNYHTINYGFNLTGMEERMIKFFNKNLDN